MILRTAPWLNLDAENDEEAGQQEFAKQALKEQSDGLRISVQPTETGTRSKATLDEGFIKLVGLLLARRFDRSQL
jgi:hypothetical protein